MNIPKNFWNVATAFVVVLIFAAAFATIRVIKSIAYVGAGIQPTDTISVDGTGDAYAVPDVATFSFTVTETAPTVAAAQTAMTTKATAALQAVRNGGVADADTQTTSYDINPHYEYQSGICPQTYNSISSGGASAGAAIMPTPIYCPPSKQVLTGYDVSETILVKVRDLSKAGDLFASIGALAVQEVGGLSFSVDNPDAVQSQARAKAIADAQSKAQTLAKQLGVRLLGVVSFSENSGSSPRPIIYAMGASTGVATPATAAPEIDAGQQKVTDDVTITYEIR